MSNLDYQTEYDSYSDSDTIYPDCILITAKRIRDKWSICFYENFKNVPYKRIYATTTIPSIKFDLREWLGKIKRSGYYPKLPHQFFEDYDLALSYDDMISYCGGHKIEFDKAYKMCNIVQDRKQMIDFGIRFRLIPNIFELGDKVD